MPKERHWTVIGVGLEVLAGVIVTIDPMLAIPVSIAGAAAIFYGVWPEQCRRILGRKLTFMATSREERASKINELHAQAVKLRNHAFSLRVLDPTTESKKDTIQEQLTELMRDLAPKRSINLETSNIYNEYDHPTCLLQEPGRTRAMVFSEFLRRIMRILNDYK